MPTKITTDAVEQAAAAAAEMQFPETRFNRTLILAFSSLKSKGFTI